MYKILKFDTKKYNFSEIIEKHLNYELHSLHKNFNFLQKKYDSTGGYVLEKIHNKNENPFALVDYIFSNIIKKNNFYNLWKKFGIDVVKKYFTDANTIYIQKLPSFRIFPSKIEIKYVENNVFYDNKEINFHHDTDSPYYHPDFEINFWMPLNDTDDNNCLYLQNNGKIIPIILKYGEICVFDQILHGNYVKNNSENTRCSIDFKAFNSENYDVSKLSDKKVKKRGCFYSQKEWFSLDNYYNEI